MLLSCLPIKHGQSPDSLRSLAQFNLAKQVAQLCVKLPKPAAYQHL